MTLKRIAKVFEFAYFGALLVACLSLFKLLFETAYTAFLLEAPGWGCSATAGSASAAP